MERYRRNEPAISEAEQLALAKKRVFVAGCGGLGGFIIEILARTGVGTITAADYDSFTRSNLNRQLFSTEYNLGNSKTQCAKERVAVINPEVEMIAVQDKLIPGKTDNLIAGHDVVIDALDNGDSRLTLADAARRAGITLISGAISGWNGRIIVLSPGDNADFLWRAADSEHEKQAALCSTAAAVAAMQASETIKVLLNRRDEQHSRIIELDLFSMSYDEILL